MPPFLIAPAIGLVTLFFLGMMMPVDVRRSRRADSDRSGNNDGDQCADQQAGAILDCGSCSVDLDVTRDRWLRFHLARTVVGLMSFAIAAIGLTSLYRAEHISKAEGRICRLPCSSCTVNALNEIDTALARPIMLSELIVRGVSFSAKRSTQSHGDNL